MTKTITKAEFKATLQTFGCVFGLMLAFVAVKILIIVIGSLAYCGSWFMCRSTQHHIVFECPVDPRLLAKQAADMCQ